MSEGTDRIHPTLKVVALIVMISGSVLSLWLSWMRGSGLIFSAVGLIFNGVLGVFLWQGKEWAKGWLLGRYLLTLLFAGYLLFSYGDLIGAMYESLISLCMIWILLGAASPRRAYVGLGAYVVILVALGTLLFQVAHRQRAVTDVIEAATSTSTYQSPNHYTVELGSLPWKILTRQEAAQVLGADIADAEIQMVRVDGSSFGLFFPLQFRNVGFNPQLSELLETEIREKWLTHLHGWRHHEVEDGFLMTATGEVESTPVSYVVFYKHFGNLGVYAVFWAESRHRHRLLEEAVTLYNGMSAPPIKERLTTFSPAQIYEANSSAVVLINVFDQHGELVSRGSGFNIAPDGLIVTNLHVLLEGRRMEILFPDEGVMHNPRIVALSPPSMDLALLVVEEGDLPSVSGFRSVPVSPGDPVFVIGNPKGLVNSLSEGIVGGVREEGDLTLYQITAPISSGSSGGPVFNAYGEVIGVANSIVTEAQNINFSISIDELVNLYVLEEPVTLEYLMDRLEDR